MTRIPLAGNPVGRFNGRNPTLVPNFDTPFANGSTVDLESPAAFAKQNPRTAATATATIGGSVTTGDEVTIELANPIFGGDQYGSLSPAAISHTYTTVADDTVTIIAEALADLFNDDATAQSADIRCDVAGAVITFRHAAGIGNFSTLTAPLGQPSKITVGGTALTGDAFNVLFTGPAVETLTPATAEAIIGGSFVADDTVELTFTNTGISGFPKSVTYTVLAGDTAANVAAGLAALVNADANLTAQNISAIATDNVIDTAQQGAIGNSTVLSATPSGSETVTFQPSSGDMGGGSGQVGGVLVQFVSTTDNSTTQGATGLTAAINADPVLSGLSVTATSSSAVITFSVPADVEPLTVTPWVNTITPTATITGTVATGDILNLVFDADYLPGDTHTVSHTALLGETTTTLATNLAAAINADAVMVEAGITATSATNVIMIGYQAAAGQLRFSESVSPGSETITWTTAPTETLTLASDATETVTFSNDGVLSGGAGPVYATSNFEWSRHSSVQSFWYGKPYLLDYSYLTELVNQGQPIV